MAEKTVKVDLRTDYRAEDGTLYRAGKGREVPAELAKQNRWGESAARGGAQGGAQGKGEGAARGGAEGKGKATGQEMKERASATAEIQTAEQLQAAASVKDLPKLLAKVKDLDEVKRLAALETRATAEPVFAERIAKLEEEAEEEEE